MKKFLLSLILVILVVLTLGRANAVTITQTRTWSAAPGITQITPFNQSLGTLDKVSISVKGKLQMEYSAPINLYSLGVLSPYFFDIIASPQLMVGSGAYTEIYKIQGQSPSGGGGDNIITIDFTYDFAFDHTTDASGKTSVKSSYLNEVKTISPGYVINNPVLTILVETISGMLKDFTSIADATFTCSFNQVTSGLAGKYYATFTPATSGSITITYEYSPNSSTVSGPAISNSSSDFKKTDVSTSSISDIRNANRLDELTQGQSSSTGQADIIGLWAVTQGTEKNHHIYMYQGEGGKINGMWDDRFMITGTMNCNVYSGQYFTTVNPNGIPITMTLSSDGLSLEGVYHYSINDYTLHAAKNIDKSAQIKATPTMGTPSPGFAGTWGTTAGDINLNVVGTKISGTWGDKTMSGTINGNVLNGRYYKTSYPELLWDFSMTMKPDGKTCVLFHTKQGGVFINTWRK